MLEQRWSVAVCGAKALHKAIAVCAIAVQPRLDGHIKDNSACLIAVASDDGGIRLLDQETGVVRIGILRTSFSTSPDKSIGSLLWLSRTKLLVAAAADLYLFDLRVAFDSGSRIITSPSLRLSAIAADNIGSICRLREHQVAFCDDTGAAGILTLPDAQNDGTGVQVRWLTRSESINERAHDKIASCLVSLRGGDFLVTGGLDCNIRIWTGGRRLVKEIDAAALRAQNAGTAMVNPPYVYSLAKTADGTLLAAGLGDGGILLVPTAALDAEGTAATTDVGQSAHGMNRAQRRAMEKKAAKEERKKTVPITKSNPLEIADHWLHSIDAHGFGVTALAFATTAQGTLLISAGNDKKLRAFKVTLASDQRVLGSELIKSVELPNKTNALAVHIHEADDTCTAATLGLVDGSLVQFAL
ncbi:hypothetical protein PYCC9005_003061 [Savitreella phatthalungensis]